MIKNSLGSFFLFYIRTLPFNKLVQRCANTCNDEYFHSPNEHYYFRALGNNQKTDIANLEFDEYTKEKQFNKIDFSNLY